MIGIRESKHFHFFIDDVETADQISEYHGEDWPDEWIEEIHKKVKTQGGLIDGDIVTSYRDTIESTMIWVADAGKFEFFEAKVDLGSVKISNKRKPSPGYIEGTKEGPAGPVGPKGPKGSYGDKDFFSIEMYCGMMQIVYVINKGEIIQQTLKNWDNGKEVDMLHMLVHEKDRSELSSVIEKPERLEEVVGLSDKHNVFKLLLRDFFKEVIKHCSHIPAAKKIGDE